MGTSGTVGQTTIEVSDMIDHIMRRCGRTPSDLTTEITNTIKDNMFMLLSTLSNRGINMWKVNRSIMGLYPGQKEYPIDIGTLDILEAMRRLPQQLVGTVTSSGGGVIANLTDQNVQTVCTQGSPNGNFQWDFGSTSPQNVPMVGLLPSGNQTLSLVCETSLDGITWSVGKALGSISYLDGVWSWFEIDPAPVTEFFRIRETAGGTMSFREIFLSNQWSDISMYRMNRTDYEMLPNKNSLGSPLQFWLDRQTTPRFVIWQVPSASFAFACVHLVAHQQIQDVGAISNTLDIPQRWYDAVVANVAYSSILDIPGADLQRFPLLEKQAQFAMMTAESEERDASPTNWVPNISHYTA